MVAAVVVDAVAAVAADALPNVADVEELTTFPRLSPVESPCENDQRLKVDARSTEINDDIAYIVTAVLG